MFTDWKINSVKMFRLPKSIYKFNTTSIKITVAVFVTLKNTILKSHGIIKHKKPNKAGSILEFKIYYIAKIKIDEAEQDYVSTSHNHAKQF